MGRGPERRVTAAKESLGPGSARAGLSVAPDDPWRADEPRVALGLLCNQSPKFLAAATGRLVAPGAQPAADVGQRQGLFHLGVEARDDRLRGPGRGVDAKERPSVGVR